MRVWTETVGDHGATLTCYVQDSSPELSNAAVRPAMLVLPGGGYGFCSDREAEPIALAYLAQGFNAFVLRYSVGPDHPWSDSFADGQAGLAWIREHAEEVAIDPAKVAAVGFSAGGHLAASLGTGAADKPDALVLAYAVTLGEFGPAIGKDILDCVAAVDEHTPPSFVWATYADGLVPVRNSTAFLHALAEKGVPFAAQISVTGAHGLSLAQPLTANGKAAMVDEVAAGWLTASVAFLRTVFGDFAVEGEAEGYAILRRRSEFGIDMPLRRLAADPGAREVLLAKLGPAAEAVFVNPLAQGMTFRQMSAHSPETLPAELLAELDEALRGLN